MKELNEEHDNLYWQGTKNKAIRLFFYSQKGLALANEFRYLVVAILGAYYSLRLTNPIWLLVMGLVSIPFLIIIGWASVHHISKVIDFLAVRFGTHYSKATFEILEGQLKELKEINEKINRNVK